MWKIATSLLGATKRGTKALATGNAQAKLGLQSGALATAAVRIGRFLYVTTGVYIGALWYTGYVNSHTKPGEVKFVLPGAAGKPTGPPDRPSKSPSWLKKVTTQGGGGNSGASFNSTGGPSLENASYTQQGRTLVPLSPSQLGVPGTALAGYLWSAPNNEKQIPAYNAAVYRGLIHVASSIAGQFHLRISSAYRQGDQGLHGAGLAFDLVGSVTDLKRAAVWASQNPGLFQEIFVHDEGSGIHLHIAFYPDAANIFSGNSNRYSKAGTGPAPAPTVPRIPLTTT